GGAGAAHPEAALLDRARPVLARVAACREPVSENVGDGDWGGRLRRADVPNLVRHRPLLAPHEVPRVDLRDLQVYAAHHPYGIGRGRGIRSAASRYDRTVLERTAR